MIGETCDLSRCFLCTHSLPEWKAAISMSKQTLHFKKGQSIIREGDEVTGIYFIYSGAVKVHQPWGPGRELILRFATDGNILGHRGQADATNFSISATALVPTSLCFISNTFFETTLKTNPSFLYAMMHLYARELQGAEKRMRNLALMEVKGRIADALLTIRDTFGLDGDGYIKVPVTRQDIASFAGTTYETVFRTLTEWSGDYLIDTSGKSIRINDPQRLSGFIQRR